MDILDTLTLARVDRENQGPWEAEYSYGGEADLHRHCNNCEKNPGHKNFIPVDKFSIEDLPEDYRSQDMMDYIRAVSDLTVRVTVRYVSDNRPATVPGSDKPYPGYSARGRRRVTVGTGCVSKVNEFNDMDEECTCACEDCINSSTPEKHFAIIYIRTAVHVVFDTLEAEHTTFHLSFDRGSSPDICQGVITLTGGLFGDSDIKGDICDVNCFTHDLDLAHRLDKILNQMNQLICKIPFTRYSFGNRTLNAGDQKPLLFIVSHPHGCSKQISLGHVSSVDTFNNKVMLCQYTTPTCPGSSGAAVFLPELSLESTFNNRIFHVHESHCGKFDGINSCETNQSTLSPQLVSLKFLKLDEGSWEDYFSCAEEEDLHKHYDTCQKNPGHQNFFLVDKFSMDDLPQVYRTEEIFNWIKIISDLTVRVSVKYVSEERPETVPDMDIPDTLTLARVDRENQGPWEAEYSYEGEVDLHRHCNKCKKNPGHKNFIPVDKFSIEDLSENYLSQDVVDYIRAVSDLTVRVTVKCISVNRPATIPGSDKPYPGYSARGTRRMTVGTGCVETVEVYDGCMDRNVCQCKDCSDSSTPEARFAKIIIRTATHVVFDQDEAAHTTFHLSFNRESSPETCKGVATLTGALVDLISINQDICDIACFTHDLDLANRLQKVSGRINRLDIKIIKTCYILDKLKPTLNAGDKQPLMFIVSHPHGCSKQISVGHFISANRFNSKVVSFQYTTPTCPGSSGAAVYCPQIYLITTIHSMKYDVSQTHSGASENHPGMNFCTSTKSFKIPQLVPLKLLNLCEGLWEDYFNCAEEEDLHKHYDTCQKNPGHQNFFPVDKFIMDDPPPVYRTDEMFNLIKYVSDLTVRVSVKYVSGKRPETVPGTDIPYPWYSHMGSNKLRLGSGWIDNVQISDTNNPSKICQCKECRNSLSPKTKFAYITIYSATHLVYDRREAEHTTCQLVVDSRVVTLTAVCSSSYSIDEDTCQLIYVSHDMDFASRINSVIKSYKFLHTLKAHTPYTSAEDCELSPTPRNNMRKELTLYVAVSHPHGCVKQISIGYCSNHDNTETEDNQSPYASITCPGSSGAPLLRLGWDTTYPRIM